MPIGDGYSVALPVPNAAVPGSTPGEVRLQMDANGNQWKEVLLYVPSNLQGAMTIGAPFYVAFSGTNGQNPQCNLTNGNATSGVYRQAVVLTANQARTGSVPATGTFAWFAFWGTVQALVDGTTAVSKGDILKTFAPTTTGGLVKDPLLTTSSVGIAQAAQGSAGAVMTQVYLFGDRAFLT